MAREFVPPPFDPRAPGAEALPPAGTTYRVEFHGTRPGMRAGFNAARIIALEPSCKERTVRITAVADGMEDALRADCARLSGHPPLEQSRFLHEMKWAPSYEPNAVPEAVAPAAESPPAVEPNDAVPQTQAALPF